MDVEKRLTRQGVRDLDFGWKKKVPPVQGHESSLKSETDAQEQSTGKSESLVDASLQELASIVFPAND